MEEQTKRVHPITNPLRGERRRLPAVFLSLFVVLTLLLGACGSDTDDSANLPADATPIGQDAVAPAEDAVVDEAENVDEAEDVAEGDEVTTVEADDVDVITDTQLVTGTEVTTDVTVTTDTVVVEQELITTVITATDVVTDVEQTTDTSSTTESEVITDTTTVEGGAATGGAQATPATTPEAGAAAPQPTATPAPETGAVVPAASATQWVGIAESTGRSMLVSTLLDANFETTDGEVSGEIEDLVVDIQNGQILYVLLEFGGFLDLGDSDVPVPLSAFLWGDEDQLFLNIDGNLLENFPDVGNDWPVPDNNDWDLDVRGFWEGVGLDTGFDAERAMAGVRRASDLINSGLADVGFGGGTVDDLILSLAEGRITYALVTFDDVNLTANAGDGWYVIPFTALDSVPADDGSLRLRSDFDPNVLQQAPRFNAADFAGTPVFTEGYDNDWQTYWGDAGYPLYDDID